MGGGRHGEWTWKKRSKGKGGPAGDFSTHFPSYPHIPSLAGPSTRPLRALRGFPRVPATPAGLPGLRRAVASRGKAGGASFTYSPSGGLKMVAADSRLLRERYDDDDSGAFRGTVAQGTELVQSYTVRRGRGGKDLALLIWASKRSRRGRRPGGSSPTFAPHPDASEPVGPSLPPAFRPVRPVRPPAFSGARPHDSSALSPARRGRDSERC